MTRYSLSIALDLGDHATEEEARERARALVFRLPWKDIDAVALRTARGRLVRLGTGETDVVPDTRPCAEKGCDGYAVRASNTGRWPERCPDHQQQHRADASADRTARSRARRKAATDEAARLAGRPSPPPARRIGR